MILLRVVFISLSLIFTLNLHSEEFFKGFESNDPKEGEFFSGSLKPAPAKLTDLEKELESYYKEISQNKNLKISPANLLNALQEEVKKTKGENSRSLYEFSRSLLYFSRSPEFREQMTAMTRMAQIYLLKATKLNDDKKYVNLAKDYYARQFGTIYNDSESDENQLVDNLIDKGNLDEAEGIVRQTITKTGYSDRGVLRKLESILRLKAKKEANEEKKARLLNEANFIANALAESESEAELIQESPKVSELTSSQFTITQEQKLVDTSIEKAYLEDKSGNYDGALKTIREIVTKTNNQSARARYYLGRQLIRMAKLPEYRSKQEGFVNEANNHLAETIKLKNQNLDKYPDNTIFANEAEKLMLELDSISLANEAEKIDDQYISQALSLNESNKLNEGLDILKTAVSKANQESSKSLYFLAKQYRLLNKLDEAKNNLLLASDLKNKFLEKYTQNPVWADHAQNLLIEINASAQASISSGANQSLIKPLSGPVTSTYGHRVHPITKEAQTMHNGLDIAAAKGTPIKAMANGSIIWVGWMSGYGNTVKVKYDNGWESLFAHMDNYRGEKQESKVNQRVAQGESVGQVNSTGASTGHHLHLELRKNGERVSPAEVLGKKNTVGETI